MAISQELLDVMVCPKCGKNVVLSDDQSGLICHICKLKYSISDDIPIMLIDSAEKIKG